MAFSIFLIFCISWNIQICLAVDCRLLRYLATTLEELRLILSLMLLLGTCFHYYFSHPSLSKEKCESIYMQYQAKSARLLQQAKLFMKSLHNIIMPTLTFPTYPNATKQPFFGDHAWIKLMPCPKMKAFQGIQIPWAYRWYRTLPFEPQELKYIFKSHYPCIPVLASAGIEAIFFLVASWKSDIFQS